MLSSTTIDQLRNRRLSPLTMKRFWEFQAREMGAKWPECLDSSSRPGLRPHIQRNIDRFWKRVRAESRRFCGEE
jgi:hypothetical protein